jgi:uncharacterized protein (DUF1330 family)
LGNADHGAGELHQHAVTSSLDNAPLTIGDRRMLEGHRPSRVLVVEFPEQAAIKDWYKDPGYGR